MLVVGDVARGVPTRSAPVFHTEIVGTVELSKALRYLNVTLQRRFHQSLVKAARGVLVPQIRAEAASAKRSGAMARSVRVTYSQSKGLSLRIGRRGRGDYKNAYYASWVIFGSPSPIYRAGRTPIGKARIGKRRGIQRPNPFPYRVLDRVWPVVTQRVQLAINHFEREFTQRINTARFFPRGRTGGGPIEGPFG